MDFQGILIPFLTILIAEIGDHSFLWLAYLSSKNEKPKTILLAALSAYFIMNSTSAFLGSQLEQIFISKDTLQKIIGVSFLLMGITALLKKGKDSPAPPKTVSNKKIFLITFSTILITEVADRSNIGTGLFATQYAPSQVVIGVFLAHIVTAIVAVEFGKRILKKWDIGKFNIIGAVLFIALGILTIASS